MMVASAGALAELAALRAKAARQERELQQTPQQMARVAQQVEAVSADLARGRAHAFDAVPRSQGRGRLRRRACAILTPAASNS